MYETKRLQKYRVCFMFRPCTPVHRACPEVCLRYIVEYYLSFFFANGCQLQIASWLGQGPMSTSLLSAGISFGLKLFMSCECYDSLCECYDILCEFLCASALLCLEDTFPWSHPSPLTLSIILSPLTYSLLSLEGKNLMKTFHL